MSSPWCLSRLKLEIRLERVGDGKVKVVGTARYVFDVLQETPGSLRFRASGLEVQSLTLTSGETLSYQNEQEALVVELPSGHQGRECECAITYQTRPEASLAGSISETLAPGTDCLIWAEGDASPWFPQLEGDVRCSSDLSVIVPCGWRVVADGELLREEEGPEGFTAYWRCRQPQSMKSMSLVAGKLERVQVGHTPASLWLWMRPQVDQEQAVRLVVHAGEVLRFFSDRLRCPYPHQRSDMILLPGMIGGRQLATMTLLMEAFLNEEVLAVADNLLEPSEVLAHELAHHWFGHLIQPQSLADTWLSEGFATYLASCWTGHQKGADAFDFGLERSFVRWRKEEALLGPQPLLSTERNAPRLNQILYERGSRVLQHLCDLMGAPAFWAGLASFVEEWKGRTPSTHDFLSVMQRGTTEPLDLFADQWLTPAEYPILEIGVDQEHLVVRQVQEGRLFTAPLWVAVDGAMQRVTLEAKTEQRLPLPAIQRWAAIDPHCHLPGEIRLPADWPRPWLIAQLEEAPWARCRASAAAALNDGTGWKDSYPEVRKRAALGTKTSVERRIDLLSRDPDPTVRAAAASTLPATIPALSQSLSYDSSPLVRMAAAQALGDGSGLSDSSAAVRAGALAGLSLLDPKQAGGLLFKALDPREPLALRFGALQVAVKHPDPEVVSLCMERVLSDPFFYLRILAAQAIMARPLPTLLLPLLQALDESPLDPRLAQRLLMAVKAIALAGSE